MSYKPTEEDEHRAMLKLRIALFEYFGYNLPVETPAATIGALADHLCGDARERLKIFKKTNLT